ncbi:MAG: DUF58 domain-containing protein [Acidobacteria bacterium]|nr:DUF58 domain-containing protein [Acidobacteriota bacterium]
MGPILRLYEEWLTARGRYLLWTTAALGLVGADTRRTRVFVLFAGGAALLAAAALVALLRRPRVRLEGALPERATATVPVAVQVRASGTNGGGAADLRLSFPRPLRWATSVTVSPREVLLDVPEGGSAAAAAELCASRRGRYVLPGPTLRATDPLGLVAGRGPALPDRTLLVYPRFFGLEELTIPLGRRYQPGGIPLSSSTGDAIEFVGTREYREGDPVRNIHFRSWARRGEPVVKEYQEEYFCRIAVVLDTFLPAESGPADVGAFEAAISVLASVADHFSRSEYVVDILAAGPDVYEVSAGRSLAYLENILDVLACLEPCHDPPFATIGPTLFERLAQITSVVAVLQDWDPPRREFLRRVRVQGAAVRAVIVRDGATTLPWQAEAEEIGEVSVMTPGDVERALAAGPVPGSSRPRGKIPG